MGEKHMSVSIKADHVVKRYGKLTVIPDLSLEVRNGEFFTLLGPSGCGKTTLLRMIAGFNSIEGGSIYFDADPINNIPAHARNIGMVFQNYAIFPHMTVRENVEYGLKLRKVPRAEMKKQVDEILAIVRIAEYQDRLPENLSGGQQQRVALARAIVILPNVLLMDEPLSNLDAKLRIEMRGAIREVQQQIGITTVYVTHDQEEALAVSDRIAVMKGGVIQQVGAPHSIYCRPANVFVATFIGHSNLFRARVIALSAGRCELEFAGGYRMAVSGVEGPRPGEDVIAAVRPEEFSIAPQGLQGTVLHRTFLGKYVNYKFDFGEKAVLPEQPSLEYSQDLGHADHTLEVGQQVCLAPNPAKVNLFSADGTVNYVKGEVQ